LKPQAINTLSLRDKDNNKIGCKMDYAILNKGIIFIRQVRIGLEIFDIKWEKPTGHTSA
jgi:hypothetical protein